VPLKDGGFVFGEGAMGFVGVYVQQD